MTIKSKRGVIKRYNAITRAYMRDFSGGGMFGFDWPTLKSNAPARYAEIMALREIYRALPD
jgi:hypothetical protein